MPAVVRIDERKRLKSVHSSHSSCCSSACSDRGLQQQREVRAGKRGCCERRSSFHDRIASNCQPHFRRSAPHLQHLAQSPDVKVRAMCGASSRKSQPFDYAKSSRKRRPHYRVPSCLIPQQSGLMIFPLTSDDCFCRRSSRHRLTTRTEMQVTVA
jgi:hypothetical protein